MNRITGTPGYRYRPSCAVRKKREPAIEYTDFLVHHGIKGQQWGIRRYQNEDGTLTEEGKQRYNDSSPESKKWDKRETAYLTDDELNRRNLRLQREQQYKNLTTSDNERSREQFKNDFKKALFKAVLITPIVAIAGIAAKKHLGSALSVIGKFAKQKVAPLKAAGMLKNTLKNANVPNAAKYNPLKDAILKKHPGWKGLELIRIER